MAERTVKVKLTASMDQYVSAMDQAAKKTREVGEEGAKLAQTKQAFDMVGRSAIVAGGLVAAGIGVAISKFAEFDEAMSFVQAATRETAGNMDLLRDAALEAGATTVFSATESANAIEELGKAGLSTTDILTGGLQGALDLAAAGGLGVAEAAGISATALKTFNLEGGEASHVADLLAAGAGKAMGDVADLGQALNQAGLVANSTGLSIEETTGALAAFASKGLLGSDAGTSFKSMLQRLTPQSTEAKNKMEELGISAFDASGEFIGLEAFSGNLQDSLKGLTTEQRNAALATIFGSDAVRAANVLYEEGEAGIRDWTAAVDDSGYAAEQAATRLDNLKGDWEALMGAVDTALIGMGEAADGPLRAFTQGITGLVDGFNALPAGGQQAVTWIGAVGGAVALAGGAYLLAVPKIAAYNSALATMGPAAQRTSRILGGVGKAAGVIAGLGIAVSVLDKMTTAANKAAPGIEQVIQSLTSGDLDGAFSSASSGADSLAESLELIEGSSFDSWMERLGETLGGAVGITGQVTEAREGFVALDGALAQLVSSGESGKADDWFDELTAAAEAQGVPIEKLEALFPQYAEALAGATNVTEDAATAAADAEENLTGMKDALAEVGETSITMGSAMDSALGAINDMVAAAEAEDVALDGTNDASIALRDSMRDVEQSHRDAAQAIIDNGGTYEDARDEWNRGREAIIGQLEAMGLSREEAVTWADTNMGSAADVEQALFGVKDAVEDIPTAKNIDITTSGGALEYIKQINGWLNATPEYKGISIGVGGGFSDANVPGNASGGAIHGPGSGTSDSILRRLSNGEHVWTAAEVSAAGGQGAMYGMRANVLQYGTAAPVAVSGGGGGSFPSEITLLDADGSILTRATVIASGTVSKAAKERARVVRSGVH